ncbi:MAG: NAD(P)/FAD-dependent oxidoreductase [Trueperaceae bacterium]
MPSTTDPIRTAPTGPATQRARPHVVILGAGFGGLQAAKRLRNADVDVTVVDQHNHHTFQPLLYQVATAQLEPGDVAHQVRATLRGQANARFRHALVTGVDWDRNELLLADDREATDALAARDPDPPDRLAFDQLILAPGAIYADFGVPGVREHAHFLKSVSEAVNLRSHLLRRFERASANAHAVGRPGDDGAGAEARPAEAQAAPDGDLTVAIVGGGPTGVELAGALSELIHRVLPRDHPDLDVGRARIVLIEMMDALLPPFSPGSQLHALNVLRARGVEVRLGTAVKEVGPDAITLADGERLATRTLIWAAGVQAHPLLRSLDLPTTRGGRVEVLPDLSVPDRPHVWMVGDAAASLDGDGDLHPQVAPVAIQHGQAVARNLTARLAGRNTTPFRYVDKGSMAIVGRNSGVAELAPRLSGLKLRGFLGWLAWLFVHLLSLPGHRNRLGAMLAWGYEYLTHDRHARLIGEVVPSPAERTGRLGEVPRSGSASRPARATEEADAADGDGDGDGDSA